MCRRRGARGQARGRRRPLCGAGASRSRIRVAACAVRAVHGRTMTAATGRTARRSGRLRATAGRGSRR
ncbi:hypothetical protein LG3211_5099 [Lysobacter gummosus]|nr:hypothetical protein LG3211_5099 [Lysobacter gummosus]